MPHDSGRVLGRGVLAQVQGGSAHRHCHRRRHGLRATPIAPVPLCWMTSASITTVRTSLREGISYIDVEQHLFDDGAQATRAGLVGERLLGGGLERVWGKDHLDAVELQEISGTA